MKKYLFITLSLLAFTNTARPEGSTKAYWGSLDNEHVHINQNYTNDDIVKRFSSFRDDFIRDAIDVTPIIEKLTGAMTTVYVQNGGPRGGTQYHRSVFLQINIPANLMNDMFFAKKIVSGSKKLLLIEITIGGLTGSGSWLGQTDKWIMDALASIKFIDKKLDPIIVFENTDLHWQYKLN